MMLIKSTLMVLLVAISVAVISAANPFDTITKPFAVGGSFKRLERKSTANFACYNTTLGDWSEQRWMDFQTTDAFNGKFVQLKNSHIIALVSVGGSKFGLRYYNLESSTLLTTTATVLEGTFNDMLLSYDQKKLYILGTFTRVGTSVYTLTQIVPRLLSFDISTLPTLAAPTDVSSNYNILTPAFTSGFTFRAVSNNNQLVAFTGAGTEMIVYDPSTTSWKKVTPTSYNIAGADIRISSSTGELYIKASEQTASPYATSFYKYDGNDVVIVKTLPSSSLINSAGAGQNYVTKWTVGGNAIYYAVTPSIITTSDFENGMQNIQKVDLLPSPSAPVSLGKTRITTTLTRGSTSGFDYAPISSFISSMYYDENVKKLIVTLNGEGYQIHGTREADVAKQNYELNYRVQPIGNMIAYDATSETYTVPYGGAFVNIPTTFSHYAGSSVTCFYSGSAFDYYRTWSPYFAVYDESKDMFVADDKYVSNNIDYDFVNGKAASVSAVENSADDSTVYIGGYFRTISGTVYNSIVARTKTGLVALGAGLRSFSLDYNYLDIVPGSVKKIVRSKDNRYLFVLGSFNRAGDLWVNNLAYWNIEKKTWNKLETTNMDAVQDIDYDGRYLYAVGSMTKAGRYIVKNVARFEVETGVWTPMNDGLSSTVSRGIVIDGKFVAFSPAGSGVSFTKSLAVWSSNAWKAVEMQSVSNSGCSTKEYCMNDGWSAVAIAYYKGKIYFMDSTKVYVADSSLSKVTTYVEGSLEVTSDTSFFNYPKKNTIAVATVNSNKFIEYNIDTKNIQHTTTRDGNILADGNVAVLSAAPKNAFAAVAMIVALVIALLF